MTGHEVNSVRTLSFLFLAWMLSTSLPAWTNLSAAEGLTFHGIALLPHSRPVPGGMLVIAAKAGNSGEKPAEGTIVATIDGFANMQSARRVLLDSGQYEQFEMAVQLPESIREGDSLHIVVTMYVSYGDRQVIQDRDGRPETYDFNLSVRSGQALGMAMEPFEPDLPTWYWPQPSRATSFELAVAARIDAGNNRYTATFETRSLPLNQADWNTVNVFIVADPAVLQDAAAVEAMRRYMSDGGRLWIMLDHVPCELVRPLLGPNQACEEVERVELSKFTVEIRSAVNQLSGLSEADRTVTLDEDVPMSRIVQTGGVVSHFIDSWPLAVKMQVGYGQLVLTTLDSRGWLVPRTTQRSSDPIFQSPFRTHEWANAFAFEMNAPRTQKPISAEVEYPLKLIGNPVVPRSWVALSLLGFCSVLGVAGCCLAWFGRVSTIGLLTPALSILTSLILLLASTWIRRDIPESVSRLQTVEVAQDGSFAIAQEQSAVFLESSKSMRLDSQLDGSMLASDAVTTGVRRFLVGDFQQWQFENQDWPPGSWRYRSDFTTETDNFVVDGQLTRSGLQLTLPEGLPSALEDPVLGFAVGTPMLCTPSRSGFLADGSVTVENERWIAGSILSDEQQRRLQIYQTFFAPQESLQRPARRLYGWTVPWNGSQWDYEMAQKGAALVALPVRLQRPAIGEELFIPHGLNQLQKNSRKASVTSAFDDTTGIWREEMTMGTVAEMEFMLPAEIVPFAAKEIQLELDIKAPQRTVTIMVPTENGDIELARLESPSLPWRATLSDPSVLREVRDGVLDVVINVGDRSGATNQSLTSFVAWQIEHFHMSLRGQVEAGSSLSRP